MKIAVIGGGICGLAVATHLLRQKNQKHDFNLTLFDPAPTGQNASGISAGLIHPFAGAHAKLNYKGREGQESTLELVKIAEEALGQPIAEKTGQIRLAISQDQIEDFHRCAANHADVRWMEIEECQKLVPSLAMHAGIWIDSTYLIQTKKYLAGLRLYCESLGMLWEAKKITALNELKSFDIIIIATGASNELSLSTHKVIKGQILELEWPKHLPRLPFPVNSQAYIIMAADNKTCFAGATFERIFDSDAPDIATAREYLMNKIADVIPALNDAKIINCRSGLRASAKNHLPLIEETSKNCWIFTGMGSKGLLYHALYGQELANIILERL